MRMYDRTSYNMTLKWTLVVVIDDKYSCLLITVSTPDITCKLTFNGTTYKGNVNMTASGLPCQRWDSQLPHFHYNNDPLAFPDDTMDEAANNCRNPDASITLWCYTTTSMRYDYCAIPMCNSKYNQLAVSIWIRCRGRDISLPLWWEFLCR